MGRSAPADYREFIRLSVDLPTNPKLALIDDPAAGWAYVVSLCYCGQNLTDGSFPMTVVLRLAGVKPAVARKLVGGGLWHEPGHTCERCPQPSPGMTVVHDYLEHQRSKDEATSIRDSRREAGLKGAASRWDGKRHGKSQASAMANRSQNDGEGMAEGEGEGEEKTTTSSSSSAAANAATAAPPRADVDQLCIRLCDRVEANGLKRPTITAEWRRQARLLLDTDKRDLEQALRLIDWCQTDPFWLGNILSLSKFRKQYDQLLAKARQDQHRRGVAPQPNKTDARIAALLAGGEAATVTQLRPAIGDGR